MIVTFVHVWVIPEKRVEFIEACRINHEASVKEPGNLRFDILQDAEDPAKFTLYEAYVSEDAARAHKETEHYRAWRDTVADWMAQPRKGIKHTILYPQEPAKW
ncbi:MAG: antibiotic biosynthesis monooxygenase [Bacteroidales bacterium]|nr:antibiotic biosynthesis monooxygenase [Bacteroidales bacterium]